MSVEYATLKQMLWKRPQLGGCPSLLQHRWELLPWVHSRRGHLGRSSYITLHACTTPPWPFRWSWNIFDLCYCNWLHDITIYFMYSIVFIYHYNSLYILPLYIWLCCGMPKHKHHHPVDQSRHSSSVSVVVFVAEPCFFVALVKLGKSPILPAAQVKMNWLYRYCIRLIQTQLTVLLRCLCTTYIGSELGATMATYGNVWQQLQHLPTVAAVGCFSNVPSLRISHLPARLLVVDRPRERGLLQGIDLRFAQKSRNHLSNWEQQWQFHPVSVNFLNICNGSLCDTSTTGNVLIPEGFWSWHERQGTKTATLSPATMCP